MARNTITPLNQIERRMAEAGRIRLGRKTAKAMTYLETFRFTSPDKDLLDQIAAMYGGEVKPWHDQRASPANQFEVVVNSKRIDVVLPPDCLDQWYELWAGSGCQRRCDGEICETPQPSGPGGEMDLVSVPCMCAANKLRECDPYTRLKVILPGVELRGVWRLQSKGWNALHELPGMVDMITALTSQGRIVTAQLSIAKVERMVKGRKSHFVIPKLELPYTPEQIVSGQANMGALVSGTPVDSPERLAITAANDDDVVDAELVSDLELASNECAERYGVDGRQLWLAINAQAKRTGSDVAVAVAKMKSGALQPDGFDTNGRVIWIRKAT